MKARDVKASRDSLGMSQSEFAAFLGVQKNTVWRWENGWPVTAPYPDLIRLKVEARALQHQAIA